MNLIEPCCTPKHLLELRHKLGADGTTFFHGYGDLSLAELLPALLTRYCETDMMIVAPALPNGAAKVIQKMMERQWASADGKGNQNSIAHLTIVTDLRKSKSAMVSSWAEENPYGERLTLCDVQQNDTAVILPDIALYGSLNLVYGGHFSGIATKRARTIQSLREMYGRLSRQ